MELGTRDGMVLGANDGSILELLLGIEDSTEDGDVLGLDDGILDGEVLRLPDGVELGVTDGKVLGADDGAVLGLSLGTKDGMEDGNVLGADDSDGMDDGTLLGSMDGQVPHVALHVWKIPTVPQSSILTSHVLYSPSKKNSIFESAQGSQEPHVIGQCVLTLSYSHLESLSLFTQSQLLFETRLPSGSFDLNLNALSAQ